jgi:hypothetical protein
MPLPVRTWGICGLSQEKYEKHFSGFQVQNIFVAPFDRVPGYGASSASAAIVQHIDESGRDQQTAAATSAGTGRAS